MDRRNAAEMIERQRRRWRSQDSDLAIARRVERVYFALAGMNVVIGSSLTLIQPTQFGRVVVLAGFVVGAFLLSLHGRRFSQIRKLLAGSEAKPVAHGEL